MQNIFSIKQIFDLNFYHMHSPLSLHAQRLNSLPGRIEEQVVDDGVGRDARFRESLRSVEGIPAVRERVRGNGR